MEEVIRILIGSGVDIWGIVKWFYVAAFILCLLFTLVVTRQIQLMSRTLESSINAFIRALGPLLMLVAGVGLFAALTLL